MAFATASVTGLVTDLATGWQQEFEMVLATALGKLLMMNQNLKATINCR